jgi:hypothetical protein
VNDALGVPLVSTTYEDLPILTGAIVRDQSAISIDTTIIVKGKSSFEPPIKPATIYPDLKFDPFEIRPLAYC